jgi:hypothetical protein
MHLQLFQFFNYFELIAFCIRRIDLILNNHICKFSLIIFYLIYIRFKYRLFLPKHWIINWRISFLLRLRLVFNPVNIFINWLIKILCHSMKYDTSYYPTFFSILFHSIFNILPNIIFFILLFILDYSTKKQL